MENKELLDLILKIKKDRNELKNYKILDDIQKKQVSFSGSLNLETTLSLEEIKSAIDKRNKKLQVFFERKYHEIQEYIDFYKKGEVEKFDYLFFPNIREAESEKGNNEKKKKDVNKILHVYGKPSQIEKLFGFLEKKGAPKWDESKREAVFNTLKGLQKQS